MAAFLKFGLFWSFVGFFVFFFFGGVEDLEERKSDFVLFHMICVLLPEF